MASNNSQQLLEEAISVMRDMKAREMQLLHLSNSLLHELITGREWRADKAAGAHPHAHTHART